MLQTNLMRAGKINSCFLIRFCIFSILRKHLFIFSAILGVVIDNQAKIEIASNYIWFFKKKEICQFIL